jgi:hypothetical protein
VAIERITPTHLVEDVPLSTVSTDTLIELTTENGGIELGNDGSIDLSMSDDDAAPLNLSRGVNDLEVVHGGGGAVQDDQGQCVPCSRGYPVSRNKVVVSTTQTRWWSRKEWSESSPLASKGHLAPPGGGADTAYVHAGDAASRQRSNHRGTQPSSAISGGSSVQVSGHLIDTCNPTICLPTDRGPGMPDNATYSLTCTGISITYTTEAGALNSRSMIPSARSMEPTI